MTHDIGILILGETVVEGVYEFLSAASYPKERPLWSNEFPLGMPNPSRDLGDAFGEFVTYTLIAHRQTFTLYLYTLPETVSFGDILQLQTIKWPVTLYGCVLLVDYGFHAPTKEDEADKIEHVMRIALERSGIPFIVVVTGVAGNIATTDEIRSYVGLKQETPMILISKSFRDSYTKEHIEEILLAFVQYMEAKGLLPKQTP